MSDITPSDSGAEVPEETPPMPEPISPVEPDNIGEEFEGGEQDAIVEDTLPAVDEPTA